jgi:hypothetical protein
MRITAVISLKLLIVWTIFPIECVYASSGNYETELSFINLRSYILFIFIRRHKWLIYILIQRETRSRSCVLTIYY